MRYRHPLVALLGGLALAAVIACDGEDTTSTNGSGGATTGPGMGGQTSTATCDGKMAYLQKDAYKETAGRSTELWPPHTTTELTWSCEGSASMGSSFQANHGTEPADVDANGDTFLVETGSIAISGDPATLQALTEAYDACSCETAFLSLDALGDSAVQDLVTELSSYINMHLTCTGDVDAAGLTMLLQQGEIASVIAELPNCTWAAGQDWSGGFDEALGAIIDTATETLSDYHVCNNDAELQAKLLDDFVATGNITACDGDDALCHGPRWFLTP